MSDPVRIDKWLWAARFYKTRGLAAEAAKAGRVTINDQEAKPSRDVKPGDTVELLRAGLRTTVVVRDTSAKRGPAAAAALLYAESDDSKRLREEQIAQRRAIGPAPAYDQRDGRPTKRDRRRFEAWRRSGS